MAAAALNNHLNMATDQPHLLLAEFRQAGFVVCGPLAPAALSTVRSAFHANQADHKKAWLAIDEPNRQAYFDLDDHHDAGSFLRHPAWLSLLDHPTTAGLVTDVCGAGAQLYSVSARTLPSVGTDVAAAKGGYARWHRDSPMEKGGMCKVFVYLTELRENSGTTALVPGSQHWSIDPSSNSGAQASFPISQSGDPTAGPIVSRLEFDREGGGHVGGHAAQSSMPGYRKVVGPAGTIMAFDTRTAHTTFANTSGVDRECIVLIFCPRWHKQTVGLLQLADLLEADGSLRKVPRRWRVLFGLETSNGDAFERRGFL